MRDLLFLSHRIPYPPDKGEKIRAWHILLHLSRNWRVHLGCFIDDPSDWVHVDALRAICTDVACVGLHRRWQRMKAVARTRPGRSLTAGYFYDARLRNWVDAKLASGNISHAFVYCSAMAPYLMQSTATRRILDMVDIDSEKWAAYAAMSRIPARLVWSRESRTLLALERHAAASFDRSLFVSEVEARRFVELAPESAARVGWIENGVHLEKFSPEQRGPCPFSDPRPSVVFVGTMDYWPNVDAVTWFADTVMPKLRRRGTPPRFYVVGANPDDGVRALTAHSDIVVTGRVPDVRPYIGHASVTVAPLRIARGIQNKVLEAMAMGSPVVATRQAFEGIQAKPGTDLLVVDEADGFASAVSAILDGRHPGLGAAARSAMTRHYAWSSTLAGLDDLIMGAATRPAIVGAQ